VFICHNTLCQQTGVVVGQGSVRLSTETNNKLTISEVAGFWSYRTGDVADAESS